MFRSQLHVHDKRRDPVNHDNIAQITAMIQHSNHNPSRRTAYFFATFFLPTTSCLTLAAADAATFFFAAAGATFAFPAITFFCSFFAGAGAGAVSAGGRGISTAAALVFPAAGDFGFAGSAAVWVAVFFAGVVDFVGAAFFCFFDFGSSSLSLCITLSSLSSASTCPRLTAFSALLMTFSSASVWSELISDVQMGSMILAEVLIPMDLMLSHCPSIRETTAGRAAVRFSITWSAV